MVFSGKGAPSTFLPVPRCPQLVGQGAAAAGLAASNDKVEVSVAQVSFVALKVAAGHGSVGAVAGMLRHGPAAECRTWYLPLVTVRQSDTPPEVAEILRGRLRRMTPAERVDEGVKLCKLAREVMRAGIRRRHPAYDDTEVELALARLLWGDALWQRVYPDHPLIEP